MFIALTFGDEGGVNGATHVGEGGKHLEGLGGLEEVAAAADTDLVELKVELGGEVGDHVGDLDNEVGVKGVAEGKGGSGEAVLAR